MSETRHTPGPWRTHGTGLSVWCEPRPRTKSQAKINIVCNTYSGAPLAECRANATLIAAAPDMLAALEVAEKMLLPFIRKMNIRTHFSEINAYENTLRAAIAKATTPKKRT